MINHSVNKLNLIQMKKWEDEQRKKAHVRRVIEAKPTLSKSCYIITKLRNLIKAKSTKLICCFCKRGVIGGLQTV